MNRPEIELHIDDFVLLSYGESAEPVFARVVAVHPQIDTMLNTTSPCYTVRTWEHNGIIIYSRHMDESDVISAPRPGDRRYSAHGALGACGGGNSPDEARGRA